MNWASELYELVAADDHDSAIDLIYGTMEEALDDSPGRCSGLIGELDVSQLTAEEIVSVLIVTLSAKHLLMERDRFIERATPILAAEPEGIDEVLRGLR